MEDRWRLWVRLKSEKALREYMAFHKLPTAYALAKRAGIKVGAVGHIVSGRRSTCSLETARAIEDALQCPPGFLFEAKMSQVAHDKPRHRKGVAA